MTFKVKSGINVGNRQIIDADAKYQQNLDTPVPRPTLYLDFVNQQTLDNRITFSRASSATFIDNRGLITTAANNIPRFNYDPNISICDGLLVEESRTNLLLHSEDIINAAYGRDNLSIQGNSLAAPSGAFMATLLVENTASSAYHYINQAITKSATSLPYTYSVFVKSAGRSLGLRINSGGNGAVCAINPATGIIESVAGVYGTGFSSPSVTVDRFPNGWYRVALTVTTDTATTLNSELYLTNGTTSAYTGNGTSGVYIWGVQLEQGAFPTTYIPSTQTFTSRSSLASYQDSNDRLIKYAGVNLFTQSSVFGTSGTSWPLSRSSAAYSAITSPSGNLDAMALIENTAAGTHEVAQGGKSVVSGASYTVSIYAKAGARSRLRIGLQTEYGGGEAFFDTITGSAVSFDGTYTNATCTPAGDGWFRCTATFIPTLTGSGLGVYFTLVQSGTTDNYTGDGISQIYLWGPQLEVGTVATLFSPTLASTGAALRPAYNPATRVNTGSLLEAAATNVLFPSNIGSGWIYTTDTVINNAIAPDGTTTAATTTVPTSPLTAPYVAFAVSPSTVYTASFYIKLGTLSSANFKFAIYDETNGSFIGSALVPSITPVTYEWRRVVYTFTAPAGCTSARLYNFRDSTGPVVGGTIFTWGSQVETGFFASSLIPTTTSAVTRAADVYTSASATRATDVCVMTNLTPWFNNNEQTFVVSLKTYKDTSGVPHGLTTATPAFANSTYLGYNVSGATLSNIRDNVALASLSVTRSPLGDGISTMGYTMRQNSARLAADGADDDSTTTLDLKYVNYSRMSIGHSPWNNDNHLNCAMRYIKFYPITPSNTELIALTKYQ